MHSILAGTFHTLKFYPIVKHTVQIYRETHCDNCYGDSDTIISSQNQLLLVVVLVVDDDERVVDQVSLPYVTYHLYLDHHLDP